MTGATFAQPPTTPAPPVAADAPIAAPERGTMELQRIPRQASVFAAPARTLGEFDADTAALVVAAAGDISLVVDAGGVVRDVAVANAALMREGLGDWTGTPWIDTVTGESRHKVTELLDAAARGDEPRWRELNHAGTGGDGIAIRYIVIGKPDGRAVVIGRDLRAVAQLQQRLLQAQQSMERDYMRLRQAESRYRLLFEVAAEAVLIVDTATRRIVEANPAAQRLTGCSEPALVGQPFTGVFAEPSRDTAAGLLARLSNAAVAVPVGVQLALGGADVLLSATLFRQDRGEFVLARLALPDSSRPADRDDPSRVLLDVLDRLPDAFVVTDSDLNILAENAAFLDLTQLARREQARGQPLGRFLGRPGVDLPVMTATLREHGAVRNFATIVRSEYAAQEEVEVSAVAVPEHVPPVLGFSIRAVGRRIGATPAAGGETLRSVEQLTELVGRVSLKEIVRESTDLIERLCIEAALQYTSDNRASAAEILGLSRQSLYSKLHRHGLGNLADSA